MCVSMMSSKMVSLFESESDLLTAPTSLAPDGDDDLQLCFCATHVARISRSSEDIEIGATGRVSTMLLLTCIWVWLRLVVF